MSSTDVLRWGGLEISFQRLGRRGWSPTGLLRSWARAPWRSVEGGVVVACLPDEAVWLGLTALDAAVSVRCESVDGAWWRELAVPPDWQLGWLQRDAATRPIDLGGDARSAAQRLVVTGASLPDPMRCGVELVSPEEWRRRFGPLDLEPAVEPPPVGRYSRVIPPDEQGRP
jgi:hypothetical protein